MRAQLLHLSGPHRGRTAVYESHRIRFGTAADVDVRYPVGLAVCEQHAEIVFRPDGCSYYAMAVEGQVFVNRQEIREIILDNGDLIELGLGGPKLRFRIQADGRPCKPVHQMLSDAREVHRESGLFVSTKTLQRDLIVHSTWRLRIGVVLGVALIAVLSGWFGTAVGSSRTARIHEALRQRLTRDYEQTLADLAQDIEEFRRREAGHASRGEVEALRLDLARRTELVDTMADRNAALRRVLDEYSQGVCLLHGIYTFQIEYEGALVGVTDADGKPLMMEYMGSGFLADGRGHVITNRHVAEPWWRNDTVAPLLAQGLTPVFTHLTATFPGHAPVKIDTGTIRLSSNNVDVAVLRVDIREVPVLPLYSKPLADLRGERVIVLGYPTGVNAMLARAETETREEILAAATDTTSLIDQLVKHGAVSPVITQGALNEVYERRLVYDAETTSGGSGGPVFGPTGEVIGVNFAVTYDFDGSNFGVPIAHARALLP